MRFVFCDDVYPDAYTDWKARGGPLLHGTAAGHWDFALRACGHESETIIDNGCKPSEIASVIDLDGSVPEAEQRIICVQNVGRYPRRFFDAVDLSKTKPVAFCSYRASDADLSGYDCVFTSFPWMVEHVRNLGYRCEFLPLAFGRAVLEHVPCIAERSIPVSFIGGLGHRIWAEGTKFMARVADAIPCFRWWGYKIGDLPDSLNRTYQGPAWGAAYFRLLQRSLITINRHGEIAKGYANNMRLFEATGCGSCLLTESAPNIGTFFEPGRECFTYRSSSELIDTIRYLLKDRDVAMAAGRAGQERCLREHCYENRVGRFLEVIESLC